MKVTILLESVYLPQNPTKILGLYKRLSKLGYNQLKYSHSFTSASLLFECPIENKDAIILCLTSQEASISSSKNSPEKAISRPVQTPSP